MSSMDFPGARYVPEEIPYGQQDFSDGNFDIWGYVYPHQNRSVPGASSGAGSDLNESAFASLNALLNSIGLGSLSSWLRDRLIDLGDAATGDIILQELRQTPEYKARFPGMETLRKKGQAISEIEYKNLERAYIETARFFSLPEGFYDDPSDFGQLIAEQVSPTEYESRLRLWRRIADEKAADPENATALEELERWGITPDSGDWLAMVIDPKKELDLLERQFDMARIGATSRNTGFGELSQAEAAHLESLGLDDPSLTQGFSTLARSRQITSALPGMENERNFSRSEQFRAVFSSDTDLLSAIERQARQRQARFEGGSGFSASGQGVGGLGRAD